MANKIQDLIDKVKQILLADPETKAKWDQVSQIHNFSDLIGSIKALFFLAQRAVYVIEYVQAGLNQMTKEERLECAAQLLDDLIVFKGWASIFEPFDFAVFKMAIGFAVSALDDKFGVGSWFLSDKAKAEFDTAGTYINKANDLFGLLGGGKG